MSDSCTVPGSNAPSPSFDPGPGKHILYFGDPMCSWCWGFAPVLRQVVDRARQKVVFHAIMGGLRPGTTEPWDPTMKGYIRHHWQDVQNKTGQPFDFARFDDDGFVYDTEPACRALVSVRHLAAEHTVAMLEALQRAFYAENRAITNPEVLADIAAAIGVERDAFLAFYTSPQAANAVRDDFARTRAFGVRGFPSIVCADDGQYAFLTMGYRPYDAMRDDFEAWLAS